MRLALAAVAALALAAAACGGVESEPNLAKAAERTAETGSFAFEMTMQFAEDGDAETVCDGVVDSLRKRARYACSGESEMIAVGRTTYLRDLPDGMWWKSPDGDEDPIAQFSPERILGLLRAASRKTERVGEEDVRGEPSVRYALTVACEQAEVHGCANGTSVVDVWIDGEGLVRRVAHDDAGGVTATIDFFGFGQPVEIEPPPADRVQEADATQPSAPEPCRPATAAPISVDEALGALRRNGFEPRQDDFGCAAGIAAHLTNFGQGDASVKPPEWTLSCTVLSGAEDASRWRWGTVTGIYVGPAEPDPIERTLENLTCQLVVERADAPEVEALDEAFEELKRGLPE